MEQNLKNIEQEYGRSNSSYAQANDNPIAKIVTILNRHHESLVFLDEKSRDLQMQLDQLSRGMH